MTWLLIAATWLLVAVCLGLGVAALIRHAERQRAELAACLSRHPAGSALSSGRAECGHLVYGSDPWDLDLVALMHTEMCGFAREDVGRDQSEG